MGIDSRLKSARAHLDFHDSLCDAFPNEFHGWRSVALFYCAYQQLIALAEKLRIDIGSHHDQIRREITPEGSGKMAISQTAFTNYTQMKRIAESARYDPMDEQAGSFSALREREYFMARKRFEEFGLYLEKRGLIRLR